MSNPIVSRCVVPPIPTTPLATFFLPSSFFLLPSSPNPPFLPIPHARTHPDSAPHGIPLISFPRSLINIPLPPLSLDPPSLRPKSKVRSPKCLLSAHNPHPSPTPKTPTPKTPTTRTQTHTHTQTRRLDASRSHPVDEEATHA
ncbi:hypothetical protein FB451DRAFT_1392318 [Mycena latifolia]|nr:hypothetical protein FB451DRAFT_1392318 [Mycena latifolia]